MSLAEQCPLCKTELSQTKFAEIQSIIAQNEKKQTAERDRLVAEAQSSIRLQLERQYQAELKKQTESAAQAAQKASQEALKKLAAERDKATQLAKDAQAHEVQIKLQAERDKEAAAKEAKQAAQEEIKKLAGERDQANKKLKEAEAREIAIKRQVQEEAERKIQIELGQQRTALEKDRDAKLLKQQAEFNRERESFQKKVKTMEHQLQKKTANELGDGAEIDLFDALRDAFPGDKIARVPKGQSGADILLEVLHRGQSCGKVIIDSKNRQAWQNQFITKLRQDQVDASADHAILASSVFPAGKKELCIESNVVVVHPLRVVHIIQILRQTMVAIHVQGLSNKERAGKMARLYNFITSESYSQKFSEAGKLTQEILELDVQEKRAHDGVWKKRGSLATRVNHVLREIETEVAAVVEGGEPGDGIPSSSVNPGIVNAAKSAV